jgi:hypothetical protein
MKRSPKVGHCQLSPMSQFANGETGRRTPLLATFPTGNPRSEKADLALAQGAATRLERNPKNGPE